MTKRENPRRRENIEKKKNRREMSRTEYVSKGNRANILPRTLNTNVCSSKGKPSVALFLDKQ